MAGILGGFLILSGTIFLIFRRKPPPPLPEIVNLEQQESKTDLTDDIVSVPQVNRIKYPEELNELGGRTAGVIVARTDS